MRKLCVFNFITLNGFYKGPGDDISWHRHGEEENEFAAGNLKQESTLVFGRVTYEMMAAYWPSPMAKQNDPEVAAGMNSAEKIVFSTTLKQADWQNTRIMNGDIIEEMKKLKRQPGSDMVILGSGSIVKQFAEKGLIDEYQVMVDPVALGEGTPIFKGLSHKLDLELTDTRSFKSGVLMLSYRSRK